MLELYIPPREYYDEAREIFVKTNAVSLQLEHSLISISKWESKWQKPFLATKDKTLEESLDYFSCMTLTKNVDPLIYYSFTEDIMKKIQDYMNAPMTATWFSDDKKHRGGRGSREIVTAEIIYYWMITLNIPFDCQKWHINRLLTLIRVCSIKNAPPKKMSQKAVAQQYKALNASRRQALNSRG